MTDLPQETERDRLKVPDRVTDLAVIDVVAGGGLVLGALILFVIGPLRDIPFRQRRELFDIAFLIGMVLSLLGVLGYAHRIVQGWNSHFHRFVAATGAMGFALVILQFCLPRSIPALLPSVFFCAGLPILIAGLAIDRSWRGCAFLQIAVLIGGMSGIWYLFLATRPTLIPILVIGLLTLLLLFAFLDPLVTLFDVEGVTKLAAGLYSDRWLIASRGTFAAFIHIIVLASAFISLVGSNLVIARERSAQKRTISDMRAIATALDAYAVDHKIYPDTQDFALLQRLLEPTYILGLPRTDAWGGVLEYHRVTLPSGCEGYVVRSAGSDGIFEQKDPTAYTEGAVNGAERDIVYSTVSESQWPEGQMGF